MRSDDLVPLLVPPPQAVGLGFRQGVIQTWNPANAENTVLVGGTLLQNLPILNTAEALLLGAGDVVGILTYQSSWWILGRITIPGTPQAVATLGSGMVSARVVGGVAISNTGSMALNGGPSVATRVLRTGRVYIIASAGMDLDTGRGASLAVVGIGPSGGPHALSTTDLSATNAITATGIGGTLSISASTGELVEGLEPGLWTFQLWSIKTSGSGNPWVHSRTLTVMPQ